MPSLRGFNVNGTVWGDGGGTVVSEDELRWIAEWGFDFVRVVFSSRALERDAGALDRVVELGGRHRLHVCLDMHEAPGYAIWHREPPPAGDDLFCDAAPLERFARLWEELAARHRGVEAVSFDLLNEPPVVLDGTEDDAHPLAGLFAHPHAGSASGVTTGAYERVVREAARRIRARDPARPIIVEGTNMALTPLARGFYEELGVTASMHCYLPMTLTHYGADHAAGMTDGAPPPEWPSQAPSVTGDPGRFSGELARAFGMDRAAPWTRGRLEERLEPWITLARAGVPVHAGECGVIRNTPHPVALAWLRDLLAVLTEHGIGFSLWALRDRDYGMLDSARADAPLADWHGTTLDRALLRVLQAA